MDTLTTLYAHEETPVSGLVDVPRWIDSDINCGTLAAVYEGGCDSGAYMPAVTYHEAVATMAKHGDMVFEHLDELGIPPAELVAGSSSSWDAWATTLLAAAVDSWADNIAERVAELLSEKEEVA